MSSVGIASLKESSLALWQDRKPRERSALALGAAIVVLALAYVALIAPALEGRARLAQTLPSLRLQAGEMQALAKEATQLAAVAKATPAAVTKDAVERSLRDKGLKAQSVVVDGGLTRVQLAAVSFASLLDWLNDAQRTMGLFVADASVVPQGTVDTVNATLTLQQQKSGE